MGRKYHCIVPCCDSFLDKGIFHFPKNDSLKKLWIEALKLNSVGPSALVCIKHFREKYDYCKVSYGTGFRYKLSEDAVPNLCLPEKSHESGAHEFFTNKESLDVAKNQDILSVFVECGTQTHDFYFENSLLKEKLPVMEVENKKLKHEN